MSKHKGDYPRDCYPPRPPRATVTPTLMRPETGAQPQDGSWKQGASLITDHPHEVRLIGGRPWHRCIVCRLGEAAHASTIGAIPF